MTHRAASGAAPLYVPSASSTTRADLRVLVVADSAVFAEALQTALWAHGFAAVEQRTPSAATVSPLLPDGRPHSAVVYVRSALRLRPLFSRLAGERIPAVALVDQADGHMVAECLEAGAVDVCDAGRPLEELAEIVTAVADGVTRFSSAERSHLLDSLMQDRTERQAALAPFARLSTNERDVLRHLIAGDSPGEIARSRVVSIATVRSQIRSVLQKLDVRSQLAAVALANKAGWDPTSEVIDLRERASAEYSTAFTRLAR